MALSGTVAFKPNVEEIITEAFERCGVDPQVQTGDRAVSARRSLNLLFSEWSNRGINYWSVEQKTLTLVDGQTTPYTLPVGTIDIMDAVIRDSSIGLLINLTTLHHLTKTQTFHIVGTNAYVLDWQVS